MKKLAAALFLSCATIVWAGDYENGQVAFQKEDYSAARFNFERAAADGNISAQFILNVMSLNKTRPTRGQHESPVLTAVSKDKENVEGRIQI